MAKNELYNLFGIEDVIRLPFDTKPPRSPEDFIENTLIKKLSAPRRVGGRV